MVHKTVGVSSLDGIFGETKNTFYSIKASYVFRYVFEQADTDSTISHQMIFPTLNL